MAKQIMNESQLIKIVERATREAISKILNEGIGLNTMGQSFKSGMRGDKWINDRGEGFAKDYIKNGYGTNWNDFENDRDDFNRLDKGVDVQSRALKRKHTRTPNDVNGIANAHSDLQTAKMDRDVAAGDAVGSRPGLMGKAQRAANVGAYKAGRALKGAKDSATNFMHNKIGLEETRRKNK